MIFLGILIYINIYHFMFDPSQRNVIEVFHANGSNKREWLTYTDLDNRSNIKSTENPQEVKSFLFMKFNSRNQTKFTIHLERNDPDAPDMVLNEDPAKNILTTRVLRGDIHQFFIITPLEVNNKIVYRFSSNSNRCIVKTPNKIITGRTTGTGFEARLDPLCGNLDPAGDEINIFKIYTFEDFKSIYLEEKKDENVSEDSGLCLDEDSKTSLSNNKICLESNDQKNTNNDSSINNDREKIDSDGTSVRVNPDESIDICTPLDKIKKAIN